MLTFERPIWLLLLIPAILLVVWIGRKSLSGMATWTRRIALVIRIAVVTLIIGAIADPQWKLLAKDVAVNLIIDVSRSMPTDTQKRLAGYLDAAAKGREANEKLNVITAGREGRFQVRNVDDPGKFDIVDVGRTDATNLGEPVRYTMAAMPPDAANRILIVSDGNETIPGVLEAAKAAKAANIPIDVLPVKYSRAAEVIVDRMITPATARQGETASVRVVLTATKPTSGRLTLMLNGTPIKLSDETPDGSAKIDLVEGVNVQTIPIALPGTGPMNFEAVFEAVAGGDSMSENNRAASVTFVGGEGRVLVLVNSARMDESRQLMQVLAESSIKANVRPASEAWSSLAELGSYEAVVLVNTSAGEFSIAQQEELKAYAHDLGGGLVMIGGDESFGAGGWIGSPLTEALPIKLDPPQKRQMPRGALVLAMHSCEVPEGNYYGRRCCEEAIKALSGQDMAGIIEFNFMGGDGWVFPLKVLGDKSAALRAANALTYGDMPDFDVILRNALAELKKAQAGQKHVILISDGDPQPPADSLIKDYVASKVSISTVAVFPHMGPGSPDLRKMRKIAESTGGHYYEITQGGQLNEIPQIFIKEAQTVKRSLIWEGDPFVPKLSNAGSEPMRGITRMPPISGYVVAADREGLSDVVLRGQENDPILAQWQHGLGRVITYTGDASSKWSAAWMGWPQFKSFWEQHIRWVMRPAGSPNIRVITEDKGENTQIIVEAVDDKGERQNFLRWKGRIVDPDRQGGDVELRQVGPGRYEALVPTNKSGAYTVSMGYEQNDGTGPVRRGNVQAAITRPFADEFRALKDNSPLLEQIAKMTGGRVLSEDPAKAELWSKENLKVPVSLLPIWLKVAIAAIAVFLLDVAVRRVRIDVRAISKSVAGVFNKSKSRAAAQTEGLMAAREKARQKMAQGEAQAGPLVGTFESLDSGSASSRGTKFEASADELKAAKQAGDFSKVIFSSKPEAGRVDAGKPAAPGEVGEASLSRLKKARQRAQEGMEEDQKDS